MAGEQPVPVVERRSDEQHVHPRTAADKRQERHHEPYDDWGQDARDPVTGEHREQQRQAREGQHRKHAHQPLASTKPKHLPEPSTVPPRPTSG